MSENPLIFIESKSWDNELPFRKNFPKGAEYPHGVNVELFYRGGGTEKRTNCTQVSYGYKKDMREGTYVIASSGCVYCGTQSANAGSDGEIATSKLVMIRIVKATAKSEC